MLPVVTIKRAQFDARGGTNNEQQKAIVCKRTKMSTTSSTYLLYSICARAKRIQRPGPEKCKSILVAFESHVPSSSVNNESNDL